MVSLRSASSPSSTRSGSRENTPDLDPTPNRRRSSRTSQIAARRKSSRLSVASVPPTEIKQSDTCVASVEHTQTSREDQVKDVVSNSKPKEEEAAPQHASQIDNTIVDSTGEDKENVEVINAARSEKEESPLTDQDEEVSSPRSSRSSDALALIEAQKYIQPTPRRRRTSVQVFDEPSTEEENEAQQNEVDKEVDVENAMEEDSSILPSPAQEPELAADPSSPPSPELAPSDEAKPEQVAPSIVPASPEPATPIVPSPPSDSVTQVSTETSTRSRRKRSGSPVIVASRTGKRRRTSAEAQAKKISSLSAVEEVSQYFEVIVLGDPNASVNVKVPRQIKPSRTSKTAVATSSSELVALYPLSIFRSSPIGQSPTTSRSTFASYRFALPSAIDKMEIRVYGRKVKAPSTRDKTGATGVWTLEADEERCRWIKA